MNRKTIWIVLSMSLILLSGCGEKQQKEAQTESATVTAVADLSGEKEKAQTTEDKKKEEGTEEKSSEAEETVEGETLETKEGLWCRLPEGFVTYEDEPGLFVCEEYPEDIACISYLIADYDGEKEELSREIFAERLTKDFYDSYGEEVEVTICDYQEYQIDGCDAIKIEVAYRLFGTDYEQLQLLVYDTKRQEEHIFNYIQEKGSKWMEKFRESVETVSLN